MQKLMETNMTTKITQSHTATLSAIHDAWEQLLKSRGLDFVEGPAAIVEAEGEAYLISWKVKGQRPYWLIVTYAMTGGLHPGVTRFGIDGHDSRPGQEQGAEPVRQGLRHADQPDRHSAPRARARAFGLCRRQQRQKGQWQASC